MCGIAGAFGCSLPEDSRVEAALQSLQSRGPDAKGVWRGRIASAELVLLHTRLSIIDLNPRSNQPLSAAGCVVTFNGEIYNYVELRRELEALGCRFETESDTEVIAHAWRTWGEKCLNRFEGMWALALVDELRQELVLSRDPFGEKPLYVSETGGVLYFASEIKAIKALSGCAPVPSLSQVRRYLVNGYRVINKKGEGFFEDIRTFPSASVAVLTRPDELDPQPYWSLGFNPRPMDVEDALSETRERLFEAVELRLRSDVPLAVCLSGGVDSTALAGIIAGRFDYPVHAFSIIDGDPRYNEQDNIDAMVDHLGCDHHVVRTSQTGFRERLSRLVARHDQPVATITYYVHAFLMEAVAAAGYKVALSGTGADELFTGYYDHYAFWLAARHDHPAYCEYYEDWKSGYGDTVRNPFLRDPLNFVREPGRRDHLTLNADIFAGFLVDPFEEAFTEETYTSDLLRNRMLNELNHETVPVVLNEEDLNAMTYSVENRSPFLDRSLASFLYTVPGDLLIRDGCAKWLLRAACEGLVPDSVRMDRRKRGFNVSLDSLIDRSDSETRDWLLSESPIFDVVRRDAIEELLDREMLENSVSKFLFSFISSKLFLENCRSGVTNCVN